MDRIPLLFCDRVASQMYVNGWDSAMLWHMNELSASRWSEMNRHRYKCVDIDMKILEDSANGRFECRVQCDTRGIDTFSDLQRLDCRWVQIREIQFGAVRNDNDEYSDDDDDAVDNDGHVSDYDAHNGDNDDAVDYDVHYGDDNGDDRDDDDDDIGDLDYNTSDKDYSVSKQIMMKEVFPLIGSQRAFRQIYFSTVEPMTMNGLFANLNPEAVVQIFLLNTDVADPRLVSFIDRQTKTGKLECLLLNAWPYRPAEWMLRLCAQEQFNGLHLQHMKESDPIDVELLYAMLRAWEKRKFDEWQGKLTIKIDVDVEKMRSALRKQTKHWLRHSLFGDDNHFLVFLPDSELCVDVRLRPPDFPTLVASFYSNRKEVAFRYDGDDVEKFDL